MLACCSHQPANAREVPTRRIGRANRTFPGCPERYGAGCTRLGLCSHPVRALIRQMPPIRQMGVRRSAVGRIPTVAPPVELQRWRVGSEVDSPLPVSAFPICPAWSDSSLRPVAWLLDDDCFLGQLLSEG